MAGEIGDGGRPTGRDPGRVAGSPGELLERLERAGYLVDEAFATVIYLAVSMERPLFLEGEPGCGKTALARALAAVSGGELFRLQCYEGIDSTQALYEWDYARQLIHIRVAGQGGGPVAEGELFSERYLLERPLLAALRVDASKPRPVLLIDEVDRADDEFEAFLLEALSEYAVSVPELGTVRAANIPIVVLTSNRTRDVHDALKRRSLYHWLEPPSFERECAIVRRRVPEATEELATACCRAVGYLRELALYKPPGVAETIDWAQAFTRLGAERLDAGALEATLGLVVKYREDLERVRAEGVDRLLERAEG